MSGFEKWWNDQDSGAPTMVFDTEECMARAAYNAGVAAERERCARIADEYHQRDPVHYIANAIAAAIRRGDG